MRYRLLGPLGLWRDGAQVPLTPAKWRMLLAVLLCEANQLVSTDRLVEELWGPHPPQSVHKLLQGYVSRVRRALGDTSGDVLVTHVHGYRAHGYRLLVEPGAVDAHRFADLVQEAGRDLKRNAAKAAAERLAEALDLWHDTPFADVPPTPAVETETTRLVAAHTQARELLIEARLRLGHHEAVLGELQALSAEHPLREALRARLMLALYRCGRQADALSSYRDLRRSLADDLGIEPGPPVRELHQRILTGDTSLLLEPEPPEAPEPAEVDRAPAEAPARVPRELPHTTAEFLGRTGEASVLQEILGSTGRGRLAIAAIDGTGGVGKSALAIHAAHRLADRFPDGQFYVDLHGATAGLSPLEPVEVLGRFLSTLGVPRVAVPTNTEEAAAAFRSMVADRRVLVVLDNAAGVEQVRPLLPAGPGCAVLITSREMLTTLEGASQLHLGVLFHDQAMALLERLLGADRVGAETEAADAIIRMCGGLPLALRIVGARLAARPSWPLSAFVERLSDAQGRLDEISVGDISVRASFHAGYRTLCHGAHPSDQAAARAFRLLGVVPGSSTSLPAATALLGVPAARAEDALERLVDAHLLNSPAPGRYQMHDLLRLFAREVCAEEPEAERTGALERVLCFYAATTGRAVAHLEVPPGLARRADAPTPVRIDDLGQAEAWLDSERANLIATITHASSASDDAARHAVRLTGLLHWYLYPYARARELRTLGVLAIRTARRLGDRRSEAQGLHNLAAVYWLHGRLDHMRQCLDAALAVWRWIGDAKGERRTLYCLADALTEKEKYEESLTVQRAHLALARAADDRTALVVGLGDLGRALRGLGRTNDALEAYAESARIADETGDDGLQCFALHEVSRILLYEGRHVEAAKLLARAAGLGSDLTGYVRWRGHAWSAFFPACLSLGMGPETLGPPPL
ncbi:AfsR/SARP family transcriptional regulator [Streptomyces endophyticus]|uniref:Tetratricopeptide repeat protein n=1 Tax=Streptomyces endophyticus TaxID=714166 RepID=A0ABU6F3A4_9ACTN|nr:BTAD domain-containing putative transcriptional regulator [Streptomyces endophyticus]MEB8338483.1 tetratricopeptide repeat protein [Streptomyces endophyticus]